MKSFRLQKQFKVKQKELINEKNDQRTNQKIGEE